MRRSWVLAILVGCSVACGLVLNLEPPDASTVTVDGSADVGDAAQILTCPDANVAFDLDATSSEGGAVWTFFDTSTLPLVPQSLSGGAFDGRYVYFAGRGGYVVRYDTQSVAGFGAPASWASFAVSAAPLDVPGGFLGAVYDGRYVYFVPYASGATHESITVRYDPSLPFGIASSWTSFDMATLTTDGGPVTSGFAGATFDGRYVYFVPRNDGAFDGKVARFDTHGLGLPPPDAGHPDAGDAGDASAFDAGAGLSSFDNPLNWATFDVSTTNALATGFWGGVFDGTSLYLVPQANGAFGNTLHGGTSGVVARYQVSNGFENPTSWSTFDMTNVNGLATSFIGGGFDGHYVYFAPQGSAIVMRFDSTAAQLGTLSAWSSYDLEHIVPPTDAAFPRYAGVAFDGRFVYFIPSGTAFASVARYDTTGSFTADCSWSAVDLTVVDAGGKSPENFVGAVFDGQYLYLAPDSNGIAARLLAVTPSTPPAAPAFGSFL